MPLSPDHELLSLLCCPETHESLAMEGDALVSSDRAHSYPIMPEGIPSFLRTDMSQAAKAQQEHYDLIAKEYIRNLGFPHTQEYQEYLDDALRGVLREQSLGTVGELCCGAGEVGRLLGGRVDKLVGIDVSMNMLREARRKPEHAAFLFAQGDATNLPIHDRSFDSVVMLGGIHHVPDRMKLFAEIFRVLKPGGHFYFREPVSDFFLWRAIRAVIYRVSSTLDHETERPLRYGETVPLLEDCGFVVNTWRTVGFLGFCLFMNSDVLVFNRLFRFLPNIRRITRAAAKFDDFLSRRRAFRKRGLIVVGVAHKPAE